MANDQHSLVSDDFGRRYWRSVQSVPSVFPEIFPGELDDATLRLLADNLPTLSWVARGDGYIVWYNRQWHDYCGTTAEQMEGWGWQSVHDPQLLPTVVQNWTTSIATGQPFEMAFPLKGADGIFRHFQTRARPIFDASGNVARWFGINSDISDQVAAEESLRAERDRSTGIVNSMSEALILLDKKFQVLDINAEGLRFDTQSRESIIGRLHWDVWAGTEESEQGEIYRQVMQDRVARSTEINYAWGDGRDTWFDVRVFPHPEGIAIFYRDVTEKKHSELMLRDREAFTRLLLDSTSEAFYAVDAEGNTTLCNNAFLELLGFENREAVLGKKLHEVIHHSHPDGSHYSHLDCPIYQAASAGTRAQVKDEVFFRADGTAFPVEYRVEPIVQNGLLQGAICTFSDITRQVQAEKRVTLFHSLKDRLHALATPTEIVRTAVEMLGHHLQVSRVGFGKIASDNETITFDIDYADGVSHLIGDFPMANFGVANMAALQDGETTAYSDLRIDPRTRDADWSLIQTRSAMAVPLIRDKRLKAVLYLNHCDVRIWEKDEIALVQDVATSTWDALERVYAEEDLRKIAADLSEVNHRKTEFLATLAHELRNPLAPIRTGLELMRIAEDKPETVKRVRIMMERQIGNMVHLIDDLLDIARISSGKIALKKKIISLQQVVTAAVETSMPVIENKRHELVVNLPNETLLINADVVRMTQVLSNLLTNAAKYTPSNGRLDLTCIEDGGDVVIQVSDNGIGIAEESLTQVFEMFAQIQQSSERASGGLGIGLSLVQRLVDMHGGTVSAASPGQGQGSTFKVRLPLAGEAACLGMEDAGGKAALNADSQARALQILVADDNKDAAEMLAKLLQVAGHDVRIANDGHHAVRIGLADKPHVAIVDIGMPGLNGYEVAKMLRKSPDLRHTVLIALTGWGSTEDLAASRRAGFDHHLTKPVQIAKIEQILMAMPGNSAS